MIVRVPLVELWGCPLVPPGGLHVPCVVTATCTPMLGRHFGDGTLTHANAAVTHLDCRCGGSRMLGVLAEADALRRLGDTTVCVYALALLRSAFLRRTSKPMARQVFEGAASVLVRDFAAKVRMVEPPDWLRAGVAHWQPRRPAP